LDNAALVRDYLPVLAGFKGVFEFPWLGMGADYSGQIGVNVKKWRKCFWKFMKPVACAAFR
jgi:hypothetical protein